MKINTISLFVVDGRTISESARRDIDQITHEQVFAVLNTAQIDKWILVNEELGFRGMQEAGALQLRLQIASDGDDPEFAQQIMDLSSKEKKKLNFCISIWNKVFHSFVGRIQSPDTLELLLRTLEQGRISSLTSTVGEQSAESIFKEHNEEITMLADIIRQKISDNTTHKIQFPGVQVEGTLLTTLTRKEWRNILGELARLNYVKLHPSTRPADFDTWLDYAVSFDREKSLKSATKVLLCWSNLSALTELLMKLILIKAIVHNSRDYTKLYQWIDRSIKFVGKGKMDSLRTIFRTYTERNLNCFEIRRDKDGHLIFNVLVPAREMKAK